MSDTKHSPLPWSTGTDEDWHVIYDATLDSIADTHRDDGDGPLEAGNAQLIVRAVNAHADLLAACEAALPRMMKALKIRVELTGIADGGIAETVRQLQTAILKAK